MSNSQFHEEITSTSVDQPTNITLRKVTKRDLPAYLDYAADHLANFNYRLMELSERGLWDTMRKECWVNSKIPSKADQLAKILNLPVDIVKNNLTDRVRSFFSEKGGFFYCTELDNYKAMTLNRRDAMAHGGARGGRKTQQDIREVKGTLEGMQKPLNRNEMNRTEKKRNESPRSEEMSPENQEWVEAYEGKKNESPKK